MSLLQKKKYVHHHKKENFICSISQVTVIKHRISGKIAKPQNATARLAQFHLNSLDKYKITLKLSPFLNTNQMY